MTLAFGHAWRHLEACDSTNDVAMLWARSQPSAPHGAVVTADMQRRGRGRRGNAWHSPSNGNLYLSLVLRPDGSAENAPTLTLLAGVALARAVATYGCQPTLKWPNDLLLDGRKVAGILTEMTSLGSNINFVVLGIGVNLNGCAFPPELQESATSLRLHTGRAIDRQAFAASLLEKLQQEYELWCASGPASVIASWSSYGEI